ncbi:MAG: YifB family Mg chelatase-like AAA ATPase [Treponema sp.]|nr:YifB family Mg chelatase-like AAA ATPase [Treponema sp.]
MEIYSFSPFGYEGALVSVEVDLRRGIPAVDVVGLADGAVKEARERMQAAIRNSGFDFPPERVLISLSPADLKKEGAGFDLPLALGVLAASNNSSSFINEPVMIMGELELSGKIRSVKGIHAACSTARSCGITRCIVPKVNADEAREVEGMFVYGAVNLDDAFEALKNSAYFTSGSSDTNLNGIPQNAECIDGVYFLPVLEGFEFGEIRGQEKLIRALQIAAAGGHNLMAVGAPGCGKTMAIQKLPALLPLLTKDEAQATTRIWSLAGLLQPSESLVRTPPFRMPHQTASIEGVCGGGPQCRPGEISLAHNGVLFLDEAAEFRTSVLQTLRVPLEGGRITLSRAGRSTVYPADFQLMMAANPCPCGNYGSDSKICLCSATAIDHYWKKFSSPLLDRIDLRVKIENESDKGTLSENSSLTTKELRIPIGRAVKAQRARQNGKNAKLSPEQIGIFCELTDEVRQTLDKAVSRYDFSPRATSSILKTARTIADLEGSENICSNHMEEAISFRKVYSNFGDI